MLYSCIRMATVGVKGLTASHCLGALTVVYVMDSTQLVRLLHYADASAK